MNWKKENQKLYKKYQVVGEKIVFNRQASLYSQTPEEIKRM